MPAQNPNECHDLIVHLLHFGGSLWVPGAASHNEPVPFAPLELPATLQPHPLNPEQTPILLGTIPHFTPASLGTCNRPWFGPDQRGSYWCVALSHLAHARGNAPAATLSGASPTNSGQTVTETCSQRSSSLIARATRQPSSCSLTAMTCRPTGLTCSEPCDDSYADPAARVRNQ